MPTDGARARRQLHLELTSIHEQLDNLDNLSGAPYLIDDAMDVEAEDLRDQLQTSRQIVWKLMCEVELKIETYEDPDYDY